MIVEQFSKLLYLKGTIRRIVLHQTRGGCQIEDK